MEVFKITFTYKNEKKTYIRKFENSYKAADYINNLRNKQQNVTYKQLTKL